MSDVFFLTGVGRSGTTIFGRMLNMVEGVGCVHESGQLIREACTDKKDRNRLLFPQKIPNALTHQILVQYPEKEKEHLKLMGIKVPHPDTFHDLMLHFPVLKVLGLVRHPLDIWLSQHNCEMKNTNPGWPSHISGFSDGKYKIQMIVNYFAFMDNIKRTKMVRYEDLITDPYVLVEVCKYLGISLDIELSEKILDSAAEDGGRPEGTIHLRKGCIEDTARSTFPEMVKRYCSWIEENPVLQALMSKYDYTL
jgi:hypothetical protein